MQSSKARPVPMDPGADSVTSPGLVALLASSMASSGPAEVTHQVSPKTLLVHISDFARFCLIFRLNERSGIILYSHGKYRRSRIQALLYRRGTEVVRERKWFVQVTQLGWGRTRTGIFTSRSLVLSVFALSPDAGCPLWAAEFVAYSWVFSCCQDSGVGLLVWNL